MKTIKNIYYIDYKPKTNNFMSLLGYNFPLEAGGCAKNIIQDIDILSKDYKIGLIVYDYKGSTSISKGVECIPMNFFTFIRFLLFPPKNEDRSRTLFVIKMLVGLGSVIKILSPKSKVLICMEWPFKKLVWVKKDLNIFFSIAYYFCSILALILTDKITTDRKDNWVLKTRFNLIRNKSKFLPNAINTSVFSPEYRVSEKKEKELLYIGRISHWQQKNPELLFKSFELLIKDTTNIKLTIIGNSKNALDQYINDLITDKETLNKITFIEGVAADDLVTYYRKSDLTLLTSFYEGTPYVILESLACGTPCIVTNILEEGLVINGENGYTCNSFSEIDFARFIKQGLKLSEEIKPKNKNLLNEKYFLSNRKNNLLSIIDKI